VRERGDVAPAERADGDEGDFDAAVGAGGDEDLGGGTPDGEGAGDPRRGDLGDALAEVGGGLWEAGWGRGWKLVRRRIGGCRSGEDEGCGEDEVTQGGAHGRAPGVHAKDVHAACASSC
jgi:hypothetical protein